MDIQSSNGANLARKTEVELDYTTDIGRRGVDIASKPIGLTQTLHLSPLCLAIKRREPNTCEYLLSMGASLSPTPGGLGIDYINIKVLCRRLPEEGPHAASQPMIAVLQLIVSEAGLGNEIQLIGLLNAGPVSRSLDAFEAESLGILGSAILKRDSDEVESLPHDQAKPNYRHFLLACQTKQCVITSLLYLYNVPLTDADLLSVYDAYPLNARERFGPLEKLRISANPEKVVQLFRNNFVTFSWSFPTSKKCIICSAG